MSQERARVLPLRPEAVPQASSAPAAADAPRGGARLGWWVLALGFGGFLAWAALAPLDNGVAVPGTVVVTGERQAVESLGGGVVRALLVREGERVRAGQPLVHLDATAAQGQVHSLQAQWQAVQARQARLAAEKAQAPDMQGPPAGSAPALRAAYERERQLFGSRRAALEGELAGIQASLLGNQALAAGLQSALAQKRAQQALLQEQLASLRGLAEEGYVPRNRVLELQRMQAQLAGEIAADLGTLGQARQQAAELKLRAQQRRDAFFEEVDTDLAQAAVQAEQIGQQLATARFELAHTEIRAPASGMVVGLSAHTVGGVVQPGARLMEIVPEDRPLTVDASLPVQSVDKVRAGQPVELMFTAFDAATTPRLPGQVTLVSADRFEQERTGQPYYRLRVQVDAARLQGLQGLQLRAGMPVEVFVRTGERSMLNYLFKPLIDRARTAWGDA
ncbi:HlyD family type I secretion periplasmic adaptor subunit [Orrella sp. JC864]|uniref:HlyD family type I secretion periplasmic adaptor subunit n=1 Tax=Orrella sp. JC864 TaxID=3120298 RepID=UPI00300991D1